MKESTYSERQTQISLSLRLPPQTPPNFFFVIVFFLGSVVVTDSAEAHDTTESQRSIRMQIVGLNLNQLFFLSIFF